jgi:hypothetical protein
MSANISIGGDLKEELIPLLINNLTRDVYGKDSGWVIEFNKYTDDSYFLFEDDCVTTFDYLEEFLKSHEIPFSSATSYNIETHDQGSMRVYLPGVMDQVYNTTMDGELYLYATDLMGLKEALKVVAFENAALHINSRIPTVKKYAEHLLKGGDPLDFVKSIMDENVPPFVPPLPLLNIIKKVNKIKKVKKKGK